MQPIARESAILTMPCQWQVLPDLIYSLAIKLGLEIPQAPTLLCAHITSLTGLFARLLSHADAIAVPS